MEYNDKLFVGIDPGMNGAFWLKKQEIFLNERLTSLEEQEKTIAKELTDKYGKGSLDIETGTFTPTE